jgi:hypothetical protein
MHIIQSSALARQTQRTAATSDGYCRRRRERERGDIVLLASI